jgi:hypothetical protein
MTTQSKCQQTSNSAGGVLKKRMSYRWFQCHACAKKAQSPKQHEKNIHTRMRLVQPQLAPDLQLELAGFQLEIGD